MTCEYIKKMIYFVMIFINGYFSVAYSTRDSIILIFRIFAFNTFYVRIDKQFTLVNFAVKNKHGPVLWLVCFMPKKLNIWFQLLLSVFSGKLKPLTISTQQCHTTWTVKNGVWVWKFWNGFVCIQHWKIIWFDCSSHDKDLFWD